jgi:hypothetical protein
LYAWTLILGFFIFWGGFVLFIVPGILLGVWFYFAQYVFVNEKEKGLNALLRSKDLVSGYTWQVFVRLLVPMLIWMTILILVMLLLEMIGIGRDYFTLEPEIIKQHFFIGDAIISILGFMYTVFFSIFGFLIYENIKQVKGNPIFEIPSKKRKLKYLAVGFVGVLLVPIIIISVIIIVFIVKATVLRGIDPY